MITTVEIIVAVILETIPEITLEILETIIPVITVAA